MERVQTLEYARMQIEYSNKENKADLVCVHRWLLSFAVVVTIHLYHILFEVYAMFLPVAV